MSPALAAALIAETTPLPSASAPPLNLDQVIARALQANPTVAQAKQRLAQAKYQLDLAKSNNRPHVSADLSDTLSSPASGSSAGGVAENPTFTSSVPGITDQASGTVTGGLSTTSTAVTGTGSATSSSANPVPTIVPVQNGAGAASSSSGSASGTSAQTGSVATPDALTSPRPAQTYIPALTTGSSAPVVQHNDYAGRISLYQFVDAFGLVNTSIQIGAQTVKFYQADLDRTENELTLSAKTDYFAIIKDQQQVATAEEQLTDAQATLKDTQARFNAGADSEFDVISAQANVSNAEQQLIAANDTLSVADATLNNLLYQPQDTLLNLTPSPLPTAALDSSQIPAAVTQAFANRPEAVESDIDINIAKGQTKLAKSGLLPALAVEATAAYNNQVTAQDARHDSEEVEADLAIPLYDGNATPDRIKTAQVQEQTQQSIKDQLLDNIALEVRSAAYNLRDALALTQADTDNVNENKEALRLANVRYTAGIGTLLEVTDAESTLAVAENNLALAQYELQVAQASLLRAEGQR
jgi:outer membrane protein TolC